MTLFFENTSDSIRLSLRYGEGKLKRIAINPKSMIEIPLDFSTDEVKECLVNFKDLRVVDKPAKKEEPPKLEGDKENGENEENNKEGNESDKEPEDNSSEGKEDSGENPEESNNLSPEEKEDNQYSDNNENSPESNEVGDKESEENNKEGNEPQQKDKKVYLFKDLNALKADELKEFAKAEGFEFEEGISKKNLIRFMIEGE